MPLDLIPATTYIDSIQEYMTDAIVPLLDTVDDTIVHTPGGNIALDTPPTMNIEK